MALSCGEPVVIEPKQRGAEKLQEGLEWSWQQSYSLRSIATRVTGAPWSILPLWVALNFGYRYYAKHLSEKTWPVWRDEAFMTAAKREAAASGCGATATRSCGAAVPLQLVN